MSNANEEYPQSAGFPAGWTADKEREYQRKDSFRMTGCCTLCGDVLAYGHILPHGSGYAHRRCILQANDSITGG
jgi:hypothetical protein